MKVEIFANYGLLGAEKRTVYSTAKGDIYDSLVVEIPDGIYAGENLAGDHMVELSGQTYLLKEVLCGKDKPMLGWYDFGTSSKDMP